jgi:ABC-type molybdate transport system substrate-binding protein
MYMFISKALAKLSVSAIVKIAMIKAKSAPSGMPAIMIVELMERSSSANHLFEIMARQLKSMKEEIDTKQLPIVMNTNSSK